MLEISSFYTCVSYVWFLRYGAQTKDIFVILGHFLLFYTTNTPKNQNFEKMEKKHMEISWFYTNFTKNYDHMLYCFWDMACDRCNFIFHFRLFCPFTTLTNQKIKIFKTWRKYLEISSFYACVPNIMITLCTVPEIRHATDEQINK